MYSVSYPTPAFSHATVIMPTGDSAAESSDFPRSDRQGHNRRSHVILDILLEWSRSNSEARPTGRLIFFLQIFLNFKNCQAQGIFFKPLVKTFSGWDVDAFKFLKKIAIQDSRGERMKKAGGTYIEYGILYRKSYLKHMIGNWL